MDIRDFSILLLLFVFTYSLLGREIFSFQVGFSTETGEAVSKDNALVSYPDSTFNSFGDSMLSIFVVLANDGWSTIYLDHYRAVDGLTSTIYFIGLIMIG
jgi:hypothetical protein